MPKEFFISDEHYGHRNIIRYVNRPFTDIDEMTKVLIRRHNAKVGPNDHTWHGGDMFCNTFGVGPALAVLQALNGTHSIVLGNHDELIEENAILQAAFVEVVGSKMRPGAVVIPVQNYKKQRLILSHYAYRVWLDSHKGAWHLYGHSHAQIAEHGKSFDIGVDNIEVSNFAPVSMDEIVVEMSRRESAHKIVNVWPTKEQFDTDHLPEGSH